MFRHLAAKAGLTGEEPYEFLNMGCGLVVIVPAPEATRTVELLTSLGERAWVAGRLVPGSGVRYV